MPDIAKLNKNKVFCSEYHVIELQHHYRTVNLIKYFVFRSFNLKTVFIGKTRSTTTHVNSALVFSYLLENVSDNSKNAILCSKDHVNEEWEKDWYSNMCLREKFPKDLRFMIFLSLGCRYNF